jgi:hypothetical protein
MGGGGSQKSTTEVKIPQWVEQEGKGLYGASKSLVQQQPYTPYPGQRFADPTQLQQQGFQMAGANVGSYQPYMSQAAGYMQQGGAQTSGADIQRLMNPYLEQVGNAQQRQINRAYDQSQGRNQDLAQMAGAYGGDRDALVRAETERERNSAINDMWGGIYSGGFDRATQLSEQEKARAGYAGGQFAGLADQRQRAGLADVQGLLSAGQQQQGMDQRIYDYLYDEYNKVRQDPYEKMNFLSGILAGTPYSQSQVSKQGGGGSTFQSAMGLGMMALPFFV